MKKLLVIMLSCLAIGSIHAANADQLKALIESTQKHLNEQIEMKKTFPAALHQMLDDNIANDEKIIAKYKEDLAALEG